jgi:hypothetical protein
MSASGQSRRFAPPLTTSGPPPTADITHRDHHFRKVLEADEFSAHAEDATVIPAPCLAKRVCQMFAVGLEA